MIAVYTLLIEKVLVGFIAPSSDGYVKGKMKELKAAHLFLPLVGNLLLSCVHARVHALA